MAIREDTIKRARKDYKLDIDILGLTVDEVIEYLSTIKDCKGYKDGMKLQLYSGTDGCSFCSSSPYLYLEYEESFEDTNKRLEDQHSKRYKAKP